MKNRPLKRTSGYAVELANVMRKKIQDGAFKRGEQLPTEQRLVEEFGVSRSVVREAITILKTDAIIETFQGRGSFVANISPPRVFKLSNLDLEDTQALSETIEFLISHEVAATGLAAERRSDEDLVRIKEALDAMADAIRNNESGVEQDLQFHQRIVHATRNTHFKAFNHFLEGGVRKLIRAARTNSAHQTGLSDEVQKEHEEIFKSISASDRPRAELAAKNHLRGAASRLCIYLSDQSKKKKRWHQP